MKKEILVVGHGDMGKTCVSQLQERGIAAVLFDPPIDHMGKVIAHNCDMAPIVVNPNVILVNGVVYEPVQKVLSRKMFLDSYGGDYKRELPKGTDIVKEFSLIQQKKSHLSKWERDEVERVFHQSFKPVKP